MGRSTPSCFKIITCGSDSVDRDDLDSSENKGSDKRGWSFRKRSARHRVLSNTVITEVPSSENKDVTESAAVNFQEPISSAVSEKTSEIQWTDEMPRLSTSMTKAATESTLVTKASSEDGINFDVNPDESIIIVIQAAVRGFLARRALLKHKNVVKLQAAVRGHLVRRHAVGTLRCVQAIVKMQALVRARRANLCAERSTIEERIDAKHGKDYPRLEVPGVQNAGTRSILKYISIEKLLSNSFARQLLESTPTQINIKCDPSRNDSAWKWLERWMSVAPADIELSHTPESSTVLWEQDKIKHPENQVETVVPSQDFYETTNVKSGAEEATVPSEEKEDLTTCEETSNLVRHNTEQPQPVNKSLLNSKEKSDFLPDQNSRSDSVAQIEITPLSGNPELESEQPKRSVKRIASEQADSEGRKFGFGSRKASNPAFIAAQSKFEELTSTSTSVKSISSLNQDIMVDSCADTVSSAPYNAIRTKEVDLAEISVSHSSRVQVCGSECGTELSISSTLDSPDQSEVGNIEFEKEANVLEVEVGDIKSSSSLDVEEHTGLGTELTYSISFLPEKHDSGNGEPVKAVMNADLSQVEQKLEENASNVQTELEPETGHQVYKSSPENSPRSHITVPESQGTPSSQVSANTKKTKSDKKVSSQKRKSWSGSKRSPISSSLDSGIRSSLEQLPKDPKAGKRRNSFISPRPDNVDQEPRDSSSSNSLPSYMQATESARAKALANSSPRSSPDVLYKEISIKKRHSLPGANGRQGSPRIQRSMSQAQQSSTKGNSSHERKWQR